MKEAGWIILAVGIVLLPVALISFIGSWGIMVSAVLALVLAAGLAVRRLRRRDVDAGLSQPGWWAWLALPPALLGSVVGVSSVIAAFNATAADRTYADAYAARAGFGWLALACALAAAIVAVRVASHPRRAAVVLVLAGLVGGVAINLYYIDTAYLGAVPLWWLSALIALVAPGPAAPDRAAPGRSGAG